MTAYPINTATPNANNDPADDVTPMNTNFVNINSYLKVDHVNPASNGQPNNFGAGAHERVTWNNKNPQGAQTDPISVSYTTDGSIANGFTPAAASIVANLVFRNQRGIFPQSVIKAFGVFPSSLGVISLTNGINVNSISSAIGPGRYIITLNANATVNGAGNVVAIAWVNSTAIQQTVNSQTFGAILTSSFASNVLTITTGQNSLMANGSLINFVVLQF